MPDSFANRQKSVKPSPTLVISARAAQLRAEGRDIISLATGEPDFATPDHIKQAAIDAIKHNQTGYTAVDGTPGLKQAIIDKMQRDHQIEYNASQILVSSGAKHSIFNAFMALLNPGDEVLIPAPYWVSYPDMAKLAEATPVFMETSQAQNFKITAEQLKSSITEQTKILILCSPSNPTGMIYSPAELKALAAVLLQHPQVYILSDEIYEQICWGEQPLQNMIMQCPELYDRTILINGVSKAYAMTGWRIGYACSHPDIIATMKKIQSQSTSNPCSISQAAAQAALSGPQECIQDMVKHYHRRGELSLQMINDTPGFSCQPTGGAFYLFPNVVAAIDKLQLKNDLDFAQYLLEKAEVAVVPGSAFGLEGYIRISYATSDDNLKQALQRINKALS